MMLSQKESDKNVFTASSGREDLDCNTADAANTFASKRPINCATVELLLKGTNAQNFRFGKYLSTIRRNFRGFDKLEWTANAAIGK
jgi:hypothetical protein